MSRPKSDRQEHGACAPSPRLRGEGRGEGASPRAQTRGESPSPGAQERADLSPRAGRGGDRGTSRDSKGAIRARRRRFALIGLLTVVALFFGAGAWIVSLGPPPLGEGLAYSTLVVDREGRLLRAYTTPDGRWRLPATRENVDPRFLNLLFAYEDERFLSHHGVDPLALARAFGQLLYY